MLPKGFERTEVARGTTRTDAGVITDVTTGELRIVPQSIEGLLGTAAAVIATMTAGQRRTIPSTTTPVSAENPDPENGVEQSHLVTTVPPSSS